MTRILHRLRHGSVGGLLLIICLGCASIWSAAAEQHPGADAFVDRMVEEYGLDADKVRATLAAAEYKQSIIDAITRPAEGKPWHEYRKIFLTRTRVVDGVRYWQQHAELIDQVAARYGIAPEVILAIIGVETSYGRNTGSYRVLDALVTLGFYYPRRAEFFSSELGHLFALSEQEQLSIMELTGSYAGAMGLGQFMPSSYQAYAVDFDADGVRDLWGSLPDAIGSVANYLHEHGWESGAAISIPVTIDAGGELPQELLASGNYKPSRSIAEWRQHGIDISTGMDDERLASLIELDGEDGKQHWLGLQNFYVITRYNRSPLYAMAVTQLSQSLRAAYGEQMAQQVAQP